MKLGVFSISLNVKDIKASKTFYENLGLAVFGGDIKQNYLIIKNDNSIIGLFEGMFKITYQPSIQAGTKTLTNLTHLKI